jgi:hypothetical protein
MLIPFNTFAVDINTSESKKEALELVNEIREKYGIKSLTNDKNLESASLKHSTYMYRNDVLNSVEDSTKKNYTAKYPWDRAKSCNYLKPYIFEIIDNNENSYSDSIQNFINNPYTRVTLFDPKLNNYATSSVGDYLTHMVGGEELITEYTKKVTYPYDGQTNVPVTWELKNNLITNPYRNYSSMPSLPGYPITYTYYSSNKITKIKINTNETILLNLNTNEEVEIDIKTPETDKSLTNTILILPKKLSKNTKYKLKIKAEIMKEDSTDWISETIYFTTESNNSSDIVLGANDSDPVTRGEFAEILIKGLDLPLENTSYTGFRDVSSTNIYSKYIITAVKYKLMVGTGDGNFGINELLTREQIITIITKAEEILNNNGKELTYDYRVPFTDMYLVSNWATESVKKAYKAGLLMGRGDNKVAPKELITKNECKLFVNRVKNNY